MVNKNNSQDNYIIIILNNSILSNLDQNWIHFDIYL